VHEQASRKIKFLSRLLRTFFSLLYHQFAWTYDWVAAVVSLGMWKKWVLSVMPSLSGARILEMGHGPGHLMLALQQASKDVIGLDRSPQMSRIAAHRLGKNQFPKKLILGQAEALPLPADSLDHIVSTFPSEYIFNARTLSEAYRVLKPSGTLVIIPFARITGKNLFHRTAAWLFHITGESPDPDHLNLSPLAEAGFVANSERLKLPSSTVLMICAQKPPI
jgi:ubiquinone/menaquinone biosynthesis C-methylase UbiE